MYAQTGGGGGGGGGRGLDGRGKHARLRYRRRYRHTLHTIILHAGNQSARVCGGGTGIGIRLRDDYGGGGTGEP